ncbi:hypothetical protein BDP27DRAFT_1435109 [Rhodocollybia butyracea]|uniref:Vesicular-fusion protein SEC18 n=1 Tax=Rhodocollybia butyracea TaxID=206335 RepID=A0A9P5P687_9AGAR|nr:hypothetical protein BDP27DRAFT_1435109 [Rhodocollybia butyracea]
MGNHRDSNSLGSGFANSTPGTPGLAAEAAYYTLGDSDTPQVRDNRPYWQSVRLPRGLLTAIPEDDSPSLASGLPPQDFFTTTTALVLAFVGSLPWALLILSLVPLRSSVEATSLRSCTLDLVSTTVNRFHPPGCYLRVPLIVSQILDYLTIVDLQIPIGSLQPLPLHSTHSITSLPAQVKLAPLAERLKSENSSFDLHLPPWHENVSAFFPRPSNESSKPSSPERRLLTRIDFRNYGKAEDTLGFVRNTSVHPTFELLARRSGLSATRTTARNTPLTSSSFSCSLQPSLSLTSTCLHFPTHERSSDIPEFTRQDSGCKRRGSAASAGGKDMIEEALLRPGRLEVHMEISLPDEHGRLPILNIHTAKMRTNGALDTDIGGLIKSATGFAFNRHVKVGTTTGISDDPAFGVREEELEAVIQNGIIHFDGIIDDLLRSGQHFVDQVRSSTRTPLDILVISFKYPVEIRHSEAPAGCLIQSFYSQPSTLNLIRILPCSNPRDNLEIRPSLFRETVRVVLEEDERMASGFLTSFDSSPLRKLGRPMKNLDGQDLAPFFGSLRKDLGRTIGKRAAMLFQHAVLVLLSSVGFGPLHLATHGILLFRLSYADWANPLLCTKCRVLEDSETALPTFITLDPAAF